MNNCIKLIIEACVKVGFTFLLLILFSAILQCTLDVSDIHINIELIKDAHNEKGEGE